MNKDTPTLLMDCPICGREKVKHYIGWAGVQCSVCEKHYCLEDDFCWIVKQRREYLGLTIAEMSKILGLKISTIMHYEEYWPSEKYWENTLKMMKG